MQHERKKIQVVLQTVVPPLPSSQAPARRPLLLTKRIGLIERQGKDKEQYLGVAVVCAPIYARLLMWLVQQLGARNFSDYFIPSSLKFDRTLLSHFLWATHQGNPFRVKKMRSEEQCHCRCQCHESVAEFLQKQNERLVKELAVSEQVKQVLERENKHLLEQLEKARLLELKRKRFKRSEEIMSRRRE